MGHKLIVLPPNERFIVLGVVLLIVLLVRGGAYLLTRNKNSSLQPGAARDYGILGGTICPKCLRPFPMPFLSIKLGFGNRLARCPYCGNWSVVQRCSLEELHAAEAAEAVGGQPSAGIPEKSESEKLQDLVDQSRYTDRT